MKYKNLYIPLSLLFLSLLLRINTIHAQPVTDIPVTESEKSQISVSPQPSKALNASVSPGSKGLGTPGKKPTKQEITKKIADLANNMLNRANSALSILDNIWDRVKSRIDKFKASGKDISGLEGWIQQVEFKRKTASDTIASASASVVKIESSSSPKNAVKTFITTFRNVKKALKDYHKAILTVLTNLKGMSGQTGSGPSIIPSATKIPTITPSPAANATPTATPTIIQPTATIGPT